MSTRPLTDLTALAEAHRWRLGHEPGDGCAVGDPIVRGKRGALWDHGPGRCGVTIMGTDTRHRWQAARREGLAAGFTLSQNGDTEGAMIFDPAVPAQVALAARLAGVRARRQPSATELVRLAEIGVRGFAAMRRARQDAPATPQEGVLSAQDARSALERGVTGPVTPGIGNAA